MPASRLHTEHSAEDAADWRLVRGGQMMTWHSEVMLKLVQRSTSTSTDNGITGLFFLFTIVLSIGGSHCSVAVCDDNNGVEQSPRERSWPSRRAARAKIRHDLSFPIILTDDEEIFLNAYFPVRQNAIASGFATAAVICGLITVVWAVLFRSTLAEPLNLLVAKDEPWKVRLLLRELGTAEHEKYVSFILPKNSRDNSLEETVEILRSISGDKSSLFNTRYQCLKLAKSDDDYVTYASVVNRECQRFKFGSPTED
ncbi:uncharacterized protein DEA37_0000977 [Paragonimus westermani]|uniref:Uncharacterized protein n=1 Tax=Paragonimus westermani TaxID=34504 RepID=A0A5J4NJC1_9TREM|nr:uncharacterized protein DEA37_0000977 [Paragonimus westermani]